MNKMIKFFKEEVSAYTRHLGAHSYFRVTEIAPR